MGVDFYVCKRCGDTFPDYGRYESCESCGNKWCSQQCAQEDGLREELYEDEDDCYEQTCSYCRAEKADDHTLFLFLLTHFCVTREEVLEEWKKHNSPKAK